MSAVLLTGVVVLFLALTYQAASRALIRLALVAVPSLMITSYLTVPFLMERKYLNQTPYLEQWKYNSFGLVRVLRSLLDGNLFDHSRLPLVTVLLFLGLAWAIAKRTAEARLSLALFAVWLMLLFGPFTWKPLTDLLPLHNLLLFHRFTGGVDLAAILLVGLGGEWILSRFYWLREPWRTLPPVLLLAMLMLPALLERHDYYKVNSRWIEQARSELAADKDLPLVLAALHSLPPGRTYVGLRSNWGKTLGWGYLHFYDLLPFESIDAVSSPYYAFSLNSDLIWGFDDHDPGQYKLFDVRYVVAPSAYPVPEFLKPILKTSHYALYQVDSGGIAQLAGVTIARSVAGPTQLLAANQDWLKDHSASAGRFAAYSYPGGAPDPALITDPAGAADGIVKESRITPQRIELSVGNTRPVTLILKLTYHPGWHVRVDGRERPTFMVSPSFIGIQLLPGHHQVSAQYRSSMLKNGLLALGCCTLVGTVALRRRVTRAVDRIQALFAKFQVIFTS
jgi:hypothetical protein